MRRGKNGGRWIDGMGHMHCEWRMGKVRAGHYMVSPHSVLLHKECVDLLSILCFSPGRLQLKWPYSLHRYLNLRPVR